jgi:hypothetical protein
MPLPERGADSARRGDRGHGHSVAGGIGEGNRAPHGRVGGLSQAAAPKDRSSSIAARGEYARGGGQQLNTSQSWRKAVGEVSHRHACGRVQALC